MMNVGIKASSCSLPSEVLSNDELIDRYNLSVDSDWIVSRTGIEQRHWLPDDQSTSDMAVDVARQLIEDAGISANDISRIILATVSGDYPTPATAAIVAQKLGVRCPAFDISAACAGFLFGLDLGVSSIAGGADNVLVIAADARSRFIDKTDRRGSVLFADGAGGVLLGPDASRGFKSIHIATDGNRKPLGAWVPAGGSLNPTTLETVKSGQHFLHVDGLKDIFSMFTAYVKEAVDIALSKAQMSLDDIDVFIPHQGNAHLITQIIDVLGFPADKTINNTAVHGNTASATIPIALSEAYASGRIQKGSNVLMSAVGAGNSFGAVIYQA